MEPIRYTLHTSQRSARLLSIEATFPIHQFGPLKLNLPYWRPGRYERQYYDRNIGPVTVVQPGAKITRIGTHEWSILPGNNSVITVTYNYYLNRPDAGGSFSNENLVYVNPVNCLLMDKNKMNHLAEMQIDVPDDFIIASSLPKNNANRFVATMDELLDSPFIASNHLTHLTFEINSLQLHLWFEGAQKLEVEKLKKSFEGFVQAQINLFENCPCSEYHFLFLITANKSYHGVEHLNSTVITLGPADKLMEPPLWNDLLSISSHEFFHLWNVKRIRPKTLLPYDFTQEQYSDLHDITEGITTYYGELMVARGGSWTITELLAEMNVILGRMLDSSGINTVSLSEASWLSWVNGYHLEGYPDLKISFYHKGAIVAWMLDLYLLKNSDGKVGLDHLMKALWKQASTPDYKGYTREEVLSHLIKFGIPEIDKWYLDKVNTTYDLLPEFSDLLLNIGFTLKKTETPLNPFLKIGLRVTFSEEGACVIDRIYPDSPAASSPLHVGDTLFKILDYPVFPISDHWDTLIHQEGIWTILYSSRGELKETNINCLPWNIPARYSIVQEENPTPEQIAFCKRWLNGF